MPRQHSSLSAALCLSSLLVALAPGQAAGLPSTHLASPAPSSVLTPTDQASLMESGWSAVPTGSALPKAWPMQQPRLPLFQGAALLSRGALPKPSLGKGSQRLELPLATKTFLLGRDDSGSEPLMVWSVATRTREFPGKVLVVDLDVFPYGREVWPIIAPVGFYPRQRPRPVLVPDPGRAFKPKAPEFGRADLVPAEVLVRPIKGGVHSDMLLATVDGGDSWLELTLGAETLRGDAFAMMARHVFGGNWKGKPTLFLAPASRSHQSLTEILAVVPPALEPLRLGHPLPDQVGWALEVTDLRVREDQSLDVLVLVHDHSMQVGMRKQAPRPAQESWGARLRREGENWVVQDRFLVGGNARGLSLLFEDGASSAMLATRDGAILARRTGP